LIADAIDVADADRVLAGETEAFEGIVRRWQGPLVNMAWRYCRDRFRAEEMAQEAFVRAWRGLAQWRRESSFSTWLFALAANVYRSELKRFPTIVVPLEEIAEPINTRQLWNKDGAKHCGGRCWPCPCATASRWFSTTFMRWT
jgi:RNA polymerase sigma-70 factor (ECF subfamily)